MPWERCHGPRCKGARWRCKQRTQVACPDDCLQAMSSMLGTPMVSEYWTHHAAYNTDKALARMLLSGGAISRLRLAEPESLKMCLIKVRGESRTAMTAASTNVQDKNVGVSMASSLAATHHLQGSFRAAGRSKGGKLPCTLKSNKTWGSHSTCSFNIHKEDLSKGKDNVARVAHAQLLREHRPGNFWNPSVLSANG